MSTVTMATAGPATKLRGVKDSGAPESAEDGTPRFAFT